MPVSRRLVLLCLTAIAVSAALSVSAQPSANAAAASAAGIYSCIDDKGRRLTSDRLIPECSSRDQRVLNRDGSVRRVVPPTLTAEERAEREAAERRTADARTAQADAVRRDRNLVARFPDEAAHAKAREAALDTVRLAMRASELRLKVLASERKPLQEEAEFFKGKSLPPRLRQQLDANDAALGAQREAIQNQEAELRRVNKLYDDERARLRRLWAGAALGSLGPSITAAAAAPAASAAPATR